VVLSISPLCLLNFRLNSNSVLELGLFFASRSIPKHACRKLYLEFCSSILFFSHIDLFRISCSVFSSRLDYMYLFVYSYRLLQKQLKLSRRGTTRHNVFIQNYSKLLSILILDIYVWAYTIYKQISTPTYKRQSTQNEQLYRKTNLATMRTRNYVYYVYINYIYVYICRVTIRGDSRFL
jgi:hypothetical protein